MPSQGYQQPSQYPTGQPYGGVQTGYQQPSYSPQGTIPSQGYQQPTYSPHGIQQPPMYPSYGQPGYSGASHPIQTTVSTTTTVIKPLTSSVQWLQPYMSNLPVSADIIRGWFNNADLNRSGALNHTELKRALGYAGEDFPDEIVAMMIQMFDRDLSQTIDFNEFVAILGYLSDMKKNYYQQQQARGSVGYAEAEEALERSHAFLGQLGNSSLTNSLFTRFDTTNSGKFDYNSFIKMALYLAMVRTNYENTNTNPSMGYSASGGKYDINRISGILSQFLGSGTSSSMGHTGYHAPVSY